MRAWFLYGALLFNFIDPAASQVPEAQAEAHSHITSAFISGADPRVLSEGLIVGPTLKQHLGADVDARKVYEALIHASSGKDIQVRALSSGEALRFASVPGVTSDDPLFALQANGLVLVLQYAAAQKGVRFVEQLGRPLPRAAAAAKPEPPKEAAPAKKPATVLRLPPPAGFPASPPGAPAAAAPRPRGECVFKPAMSDDDLYNCGARP